MLSSMLDDVKGESCIEITQGAKNIDRYKGKGIFKVIKGDKWKGIQIRWKGRQIL